MGVTFGVSHCGRNRLRDCDTRVQRTISGPKTDKVTGDLKSLLNGELYDSYCCPRKYYSDNQVKNNENGGACSTYERKDRGLQGFGGEHEGKETT